MTFKAWRTTSFEHTHENNAFNHLHDLLQKHWRHSDEALHLLGNVYVDGCEIDAIVIKRNALIIIDFKDYGGELRFSENNRWIIDGATVRGGNQNNPYQQIRKNKYQLLNYLNLRVNFKQSHNLGHIAGLCLFQQKIDFDIDQIPPGISRWFHIADFTTAFRLSNAIVSSEINFSDDEIEAILTAFDLRPWHPDGVTQEVSFPDYGRAYISSILLNNEQSQALAAINEWLLDSEYPIFSLSGAYGTGKSKVLEVLLAQMPAAIIIRRYLAPNARIASLHDKAISIYSWLYSHTPQGLKEDTPFYPVSCQDKEVLGQPQQSLLVIFDAHLLGNEFFASETALYGSGHLISDLLQALKGNERDRLSRPLPKILLLGDPYQLRRGAKEKSLLECLVFKQMQIPYLSTELKSQYRGKESPIEQLDFQRELVGQLAAQRFIQLPICQQDHFRTINRGEHSDQIAEVLLSSSGNSVYLCATHERAQAVNFSIRRKYLQAKSAGYLVAGDRVEIYNNTIHLEHDKDVLTQQKWCHAGGFATVKESAKNIFSKTINLQGREKPTVVDFAEATLEYNGYRFTVFYLPEFLSSLKPEVAADTLLALRIWAREEANLALLNKKAELDKLKESVKSYQDALNHVNARKDQLLLEPVSAPEEYELAKLLAQAEKRYKEANQQYQKDHGKLILKSKFTYAARLRYAWALTVHRAQSHAPFHQVFLDASAAHDTDNPATDSYFRWLYTAITRTENELGMLRYPTLTPLSKTDWHLTSLRIAPLVVKQRFYFAKDRLPTDSELKIVLPTGFSHEVPELFALLLEVESTVQPVGWRITTVTQHRYKERYLFQCERGEVELDFDYNGKFEVTLGKCQVFSGEVSLGNELKQLLNKPPLWRDNNVHTAMQYIDALLAAKAWQIIDGDEKPYKVFVIAKHAIGKIKLDINIPSESSVSRKGVISSIHLVQADSEAVSAQFKADFIDG